MGPLRGAEMVCGCLATCLCSMSHGSARGGSAGPSSSPGSVVHHHSWKGCEALLNWVRLAVGPASHWQTGWGWEAAFLPLRRRVGLWGEIDGWVLALSSIVQQ